MLISFPVGGVLLAVSICLSGAFFVYGFNTLHLTIRARRYRPSRAGPMLDRPTVAVHLPIYNELYVVGRLLAVCVVLAETYGRDLVKVYVIDDSTDETSSVIDGLVAEYRAKGLGFEVIRRGSRSGFKAGALQAALNATKEKYVAVLDADFVPPPDFLDRSIPLLEQDQTVGFVQSRWGHLDRHYNTVTESLAIGVDAHFLLEQRGRNGSGYLMNFNGSAGVLRAEAIREAGGWAADTLAEDLDLSYRLQLTSYRGVYLNDLEVPGELPPTIASLKRQQGRWARGSLQTAKKLFSQIASSKRLSLGQKTQAAVHLTYYLVHPLMIASFLIAVAADFLSIDVIKYSVNITIPSVVQGSSSIGLVMVGLQVAPWVVFSILIAMSTFAVLFYCVEAVRVQKLGILENAKKIILLVILGYGISISNSVQALSGLFSSETGTFSRTPKYAISRSGETWQDKKYQLSLNTTTALEAGAVVLASTASVWALITKNLGILPILLVYLTGYSFVLYLTLREKIGSGGRLDA
ncbi:MAG: glycosyltransferase [Nitrososphaerales archaeon]|nr:glycosyltransferase [Nitrososphaerales archaeon]